MPYHRPNITALDVVIIVLGAAIAAPFVSMLVAPFTNGL